MADATSKPEGFSLRRWSRRKLEAANVATPPSVPAAAAPAPPDADAVAAPPVVVPAPTEVNEPPALPAVESLTHDSDFSAFMQPKVDEVVKRAALKKLFTDPRFNVMDGLDIYIGDYTQPDPMPEGMLAKLGKVYAAVTKEEEAKEPLAAPEPPMASAESPSAPTIPPDTAPAKTAAEEGDDPGAAPADAPTPPVASGAPTKPQASTADIPPLAQPRGKPL